MTVDPVARGTGPDPRVEAEVRGAALGQLLAGGPLAESVHVVLVLVVSALVWNSLPLARTLGWVGAVTAAAALRTWWRRRTGVGVRCRRRDPRARRGTGRADPGGARRDRRWGDGDAGRRPAQLPLPADHHARPAPRRHPVAGTRPYSVDRDPADRAVRLEHGPGAPARPPYVRGARARHGAAGIVETGAS